MSGEQVVAELERLNVRIFHSVDVAPPTVVPAELLASMAVSKEPRIEMALVLLFLEQPEYSAYVEEAASLIDPSPCTEALRLYYQAAAYLQAEIGVRGKRALPDLYSQRFQSPAVRFGASRAETDEALNALATCHARLALAFADVTNWRNTYRKQISLYLSTTG